MGKVNIGFDVGSVSINTVICNSKGELIEELPYRRHFGKTIELCSELLKQIENRYGKENIERIAFTGTHGKAIAQASDCYFEIETTAQTKGLYRLMPEARTVISIGGHDSALLLLSTSKDGFILNDFKLNEACAAGTGSFIDQQAERIFSDDKDLNTISDPQKRIESILHRFIDLGSQSDKPANVACRCTVFTKSDMIHLQNKGIPIKHIIAGLHQGVARNYRSTMILNRKLETPAAFIGGYASNRLARKAFEDILGIKVTVPNHYTGVGAFGVILNAIEKDCPPTHITSETILNLKSSKAFSAPRTEPLQIKYKPFCECGVAEGLPQCDRLVDVYMGFDIGSTTTKLVLITPKGKVIYKRYIPTEGQPVVAIKKALQNCVETIDINRINILGVGTTGSGREVAALFAGADDVVNEVTAHAKGTTFFDPEIDTIFELGGQDAKFTSLKDGFVVDFKMNKVCAAGTGSFLEETANKLGINIAGEYENLAMSAKAPYRLTERCTVYMESDLMSYLQMGGDIKDLLAGLSQAVVHNYLNRVVQDGKIGNKISFQGGPSLNRSVVAAFESITKKPITTLPHREVMGAIGAALHAMEEMKQNATNTTKFKGWDIINQDFAHREEVCHRNPNCHNQCKLQIYRIGNETAIYGGECGMYESRSQASKKTPDFSKIRQNLFYQSIKGLYRVLNSKTANYTSLRAEGMAIQSIPSLRAEGVSIQSLPSLRAKGVAIHKIQSKIHKITIGIPRSLSFHQLGIFWIHLLHDLGFEIVITPETNNEIVNAGLAVMTCETCFPVKISHGHAAILKDKCDYLFMPMMIEMNSDRKDFSFYCPYVESNFYMLKAALNLDINKTIKPAVYINQGLKAMEKAFVSEFNRLGLKFDSNLFEQAYNNAWEAYNNFEAKLHSIGKEVLKNLGNKPAIVVLGRPYSTYDNRTNLNLFATFSRLGVYAIPQEFFDLSEYEIEKEYSNMYWGFGNKILRAAKFINGDQRLFGLYLTSFSCGPDSFILHFFSHEMSKTKRPYLELELDEHSAGAGVETRLLAFVDAIKNQKSVTTSLKSQTINIIPQKSEAPITSRTMYMPHMCDGVVCLAACFDNIGVKTEIMPTCTEKGLAFGKKNTSGKECFPCIVTTGDMFNQIEILKKQGADLKKDIAFFMPEAEGPCRFGQYNKLHRILLDKYGYSDIPIISPTCEDSYSCRGLIKPEILMSFKMLVCQAIVYQDILEKARWRIRPYEKIKGTTDRVFNNAINAAVNAIRAGGGLKLFKEARKAAHEFDNIEVNDEIRPLIGIVGEIFVRVHQESNQYLIRQLEAMGCEGYISSISEWISYTADTSLGYALDEIKEEKSFGNFLNAAASFGAYSYQALVTKILMQPFARILKNRQDHSTKHILEAVGDKYSNHIKSESILSIGAALSFMHDGFDGIVNAMPFTCMPSTVASSILKVYTRGNIPFVDMVYDGSIQPNRETNLATFVFQAKQHRQTRK